MTVFAKPPITTFGGFTQNIFLFLSPFKLIPIPTVIARGREGGIVTVNKSKNSIIRSETPCLLNKFGNINKNPIIARRNKIPINCKDYLKKLNEYYLGNNMERIS